MEEQTTRSTASSQPKVSSVKNRRLNNFLNNVHDTVVGSVRTRITWALSQAVNQSVALKRIILATKDYNAFPFKLIIKVFNAI